MLLQGKKALILGLANNKSIAFVTVKIIYTIEHRLLKCISAICNPLHFVKTVFHHHLF